MFVTLYLEVQFRCLSDVNAFFTFLKRRVEHGTHLKAGWGTESQGEIQHGPRRACL